MYFIHEHTLNSSGLNTKGPTTIYFSQLNEGVVRGLQHEEKSKGRQKDRRQSICFVLYQSSC